MTKRIKCAVILLIACAAVLALTIAVFAATGKKEKPGSGAKFVAREITAYETI